MEQVRIIDSLYYSLTSSGLSINILLHVLLASLIVIGVYAVMARDWKSISKLSLWLLFVEYIAFVISLTVVYREVSTEREYILMPFWSYTAMRDVPDLINEILLNILLFIPIGVIGKFAVKQTRYVLAIGFLLSSSIEFLQFIFKKGFAELDDVMHNFIGCVIGVMITTIINLTAQKCIRIFSKE